MTQGGDTATFRGAVSSFFTGFVNAGVDDASNHAADHVATKAGEWGLNSGTTTWIKDGVRSGVQATGQSVISRVMNDNYSGPGTVRGQMAHHSYAGSGSVGTVHTESEGGFRPHHPGGDVTFTQHGWSANLVDGQLNGEYSSPVNGMFDDYQQGHNVNSSGTTDMVVWHGDAHPEERVMSFNHGTNDSVATSTALDHGTHHYSGTDVQEQWGKYGEQAYHGVKHVLERARDAWHDYRARRSERYHHNVALHAAGLKQIIDQTARKVSKSVEAPPSHRLADAVPTHLVSPETHAAVPAAGRTPARRRRRGDPDGPSPSAYRTPTPRRLRRRYNPPGGGYGGSAFRYSGLWSMPQEDQWRYYKKRSRVRL